LRLESEALHESPSLFKGAQAASALATARAKPIAEYVPTRVGVSPGWLCWNIVRLLSGTAICAPLLFRLESEALHESPSLFKGAQAASALATARSKPIAHAVPTRVGVSPGWLCWNIVRLLSGTAICAPLLFRLESEALHESPSLLKGAQAASALATARSKPIAYADPTGFGINRIGCHWNIIRLLSGTAICAPLLFRLEPEVLHESPGLLKVPPIASIAAGPSEKVNPTVTTGFGITPIGCSWNIIRLSPGTAICEPLLSRLESEVLHESPGLLKVPPTAFALAVSEPIAHADPTGFGINRIGTCWNVVR